MTLEVTDSYHGTRKQNVMFEDKPKSYPNDDVLEGYDALKSVILGVAQVGLGGIAIIANAVAIPLTVQSTDGNNVAYSGMGLLAGTWFIATGIFGIQAKSKVRCTVTFFTVFSIIGVSLFNVVLLGVSATGIRDAANQEELLVTMVFLLIVAIVMFVVGILSSLLGCSAICGGQRHVKAEKQFSYFTNHGYRAQGTSGVKSITFEDFGPQKTSSPRASPNRLGYPGQPTQPQLGAQGHPPRGSDIAVQEGTVSFKVSSG